MACNRHPSESTVGVCAACLRERLLALLATSSHESPPSLYSTSSAAADVADGPRSSSLLSTLFSRHGRGHGGRDEHKLRRFASWAPALSRLFSASSAAAGTGRGTSPGDSSRKATTGIERVTLSRRASDVAAPAKPWHRSSTSRETTKHRRLGLGGLSQCFVAAGDGEGKGFSGEIRASRGSQQGQRRHKAAARRSEMEGTGTY
ncbi:uncharacterized protein LOC141837779 [Curcuma longa]|uniref:uncharacterized protein LOC141837779 n=1 Tax=Curcuma longa TaxID=136217 RepID=UPI003D9F4DAC